MRWDLLGSVTYNYWNTIYVSIYIWCDPSDLITLFKRRGAEFQCGMLLQAKKV